MDKTETSKTVGAKVKCLLCEQILQSKHRHDYVMCKCGNLSVDGGSDYLKISSNSNLYKILK